MKHQKVYNVITEWSLEHYKHSSIVDIRRRYASLSEGTDTGRKESAPCVITSAIGARALVL